MPRVEKVCFKTKFINQKDDNWFDFKVAPLGEQLMVVTNMFDTLDFISGKNLFQGKGLPEALVIEAQRVYPNKTIVSDSGGALWEPGRAVWQKLVDKKLAIYNPGNDRFDLNR